MLLNNVTYISILRNTINFNHPDCGGVTQEPQNKNKYTLRKGKVPKKSPHKEISWIPGVAGGGAQQPVESREGSNFLYICYCSFNLKYILHE